MVDRPSLAEAFRADRTTMGTTLKSVAPNLAEALGYTPVEFLFVDRQHGSPVTERLEDIVRAADLNDLPVVVRVPTDDLSMITYFLDIGVAAIMLPQVEDPAVVAEASEHVRYHDGRSIATTSRAAGFGAVDAEEYVDYVNEDVALLPQLESEAGVEIADEVAAMEETTAVAIGPGDLSRSLGVEFGSDAHRDAIDRVFDAAAENDRPAGTFVGDEAGIERYSDVASFLIYSSDVAVVMSHFADVLGE